jgi:hypothetical protein
MKLDQANKFAHLFQMECLRKPHQTQNTLALNPRVIELSPVDPSYVRLNVPGHRQEKVQLLADSEQAYFVFDVVFGFAVVVFGVLVVAIVKGNFFSSQDGTEEPLLVSEEQKYDAENV